MSLPELNLDDRRFQELMDDARRRIVRNCPEWTEHNVSDPGIALVEAFAWMTDMLVYRINRLPEKVHIALLDLLDVSLGEPEAARADVEMRLAAPARRAILIPARTTEVATERIGKQQPVVFQAVENVTIPPLEPAAYVVRRDGAVSDVGVGAGVARPHGGDEAPFATPPVPDDALHLGFEHPLDRLLVRVAVDAVQALGAGVEPRDPPLRWEVSGPAGSWHEAQVLADTTGGFNLGGGHVELQLPPRSAVQRVGERTLHWLRCRVDATGRSGREARYSRPPQIRSITAEAIGALVPVEHAATELGEALGHSDGTPGQSFRLRHAPALELDDDRETLEVQNPETREWIRWERRDSFDGSDQDDPHFWFDPATAEVRLGPAIRRRAGDWRQHGAVPPQRSALRMTAYRHGGGREGNVRAGTLTVLRTPIPGVARVANPRAANGGVDGESLDSARRRAALELRTRYRAVTVEDYEVIAERASQRVARAYCSPPRDGGPVVVRVLPRVADPHAPLERDRAIPDEALVREVTEELDRRRVVGTSLHVAEMRLRAATVAVEVQVPKLADPQRVTAEVLAALYAYVNPFVPHRIHGGEDGWPFGRPLTAAELHGIVTTVSDVAHVTLLRLYEVDLATGRRVDETAVERIELEPDEVIASATHHVNARRRA